MPVAQPGAMEGLGQHASGATRVAPRECPPALLTLAPAFPRPSRWPLGVALTSWRYMWRTTPLHRSEVRGAARGRRAAASCPAGVRRDEVLAPARRRRPALPPPSTARRIREADMGAARSSWHASAPTSTASRRASSRASRRCAARRAAMAVGDEYVVRMPGPWDGPVRVIERTPQLVPLRHARRPPRGGADPLRRRATRELLEFTHRVVGARGRPALEPALSTTCA